METATLDAPPKAPYDRHAGPPDGFEYAVLKGKQFLRPLRNVRPTQRTFRRVRAVLRLLGRGCTQRDACAQVGIHESTWSGWKAEHPRLAKLHERAESAAVNRLLSRVEAGTDIKGNPDWKAPAWILERRFNDRGFAPPKSTETTVNVNNQTLHVNLTADQLAALSAAHSAAVAGLALSPAQQVRTIGAPQPAGNPAQDVR